MHTPRPRRTREVWEGENHIMGKLNTQGKRSRHWWALHRETLARASPASARLSCWERDVRASAWWQVFRV